MSEAGPHNEALAAAFTQHREQVYRFLLRRTGSHHDAEELTQRVFLEAAESLRRSPAPPDSMLAWLYTVAERRFIDEVRRRETARRGVAMLEPAPAPDPVYGRELGRALRDAIDQLPDEQRVVVVSKIIQGRPFSEIAAELGITVDACKMRLSRAVARIRTILEGQGVRGDD